MATSSPYDTLLRMSQSAMLFLIVGAVLAISGVVDLVNGTTVLGSAGSAVLVFLGIVFLIAGLWGLYLSRPAWMGPTSVPRGA